ncbi:golgin candidate 3-like isoform X2 [Corylus avellana]|uniref:golgin candidate 3-like isoform X2 n=1 Tax=Corylus avellana TaxID=13451 RepID=UPI00286C120C|nr:golgin candidate 3-like isoform X2 [Corylus avellana]
MMWNSIANLKENLNKIALDVHDHDDDDEEDELEIYASRNGLEDSSVSDRRNSHSFAHSKSVSRSPVPNGIDSAYNFEIERYKAEIKKLQESESEIKALSVNYAALLKEKEDQISRLSKDYGTLKQNLDATNAALHASGNESAKALTNGVIVHKGSTDQSARQHKFTTQVKNRYAGNQKHNGVVSKQDAISNGVTHAVQSDVTGSKMEAKDSNLLGKEKELADLLEERNRSPAAVQLTPDVKQLRIELEKEHDKLAIIQSKLQEEQKLNESFHAELKSLKLDRDRTSKELSKICNELSEKNSEIKRLQMELNRREDDDAGGVLDGLKRVIVGLEKEISSLKMEKNELKVALEMSRNSLTDKVSSTGLNEEDSPGSFPGKEQMELSLQNLDKDLKETRHERDKALHELARLKQHLLEKESEESEKMDEDSKIIEQLRENNEYQRAQISYLEKALKVAIANQEEIKTGNSNEIQKSKEIIDDLNRKLANCMTAIDAKNLELLNLQTALGQYYAEIEAKEHLEGDLARAREASAKLSKLLEDADQREEVSKGEKEEILAKLSQAEKTLAEWKIRVNKLEEDNAKLRRAVEQSMTRLNRMSVDSDYLVDRRIVIKLLVTYFQRNHSKEVLGLMVRMLGFSDEDKQRIGAAQQVAGKGVVRGVLGLPGRLVGGILGGGSAESPANAASENHSFADLWVDFLLKETEERERRELAHNGGMSKEDSHGIGAGPPVANQTTNSAATALSFSRSNLSPGHNSSQFPSHGNFRHSEHFDSEFSTVPLTSSDNTQQISRLLPKY